MYLDSAYIAKFYVNEPDAPKVRDLIRRAAYICSSSWAELEISCVFKRHVREGWLTAGQGSKLMDAFIRDTENNLWSFAPITDALLTRTVRLVSRLRANVPLRAGDAIHIATAIDLGETEIWTNDRHLVAAAPHFGIAGRSV